MDKNIKKTLEEEKKILLENQISLINNSSLINEVITLQEASDILHCSDSTLRTQVLKGKFKNGLEYRKAKGTILFTKSFIERLKVENKKRKVENDMEKQKRNRLANDELKVIDNIIRDCDDEKMLLIYSLVRNHALRLGEVLDIEKDNIKNGEIKIQSYKQNDYLTIHLTDKENLLVKKIANISPSKHLFSYIGKSGEIKTLQGVQISSKFKKLTNKSLRDIRYYALIEIVNNSMILETERLMRHSNATTLKEYLEVK